MMPGVGFEEMILLALVAIVVIGPKDLPLMMRKFGRFTGKMRAMAFEFKQGFDELGRQAELDELRKEVQNLKHHTGLEDLKKEFEQDRIAMESDVNKAMAPPASPASAVPTPTHPAAAAAAATLPYAGLSAEHPGYDAGDDFRIDGAAPLPEPEQQPVNGTHALGENAGDPHIIPDDEAPLARPAPVATPIKQDTPA
jgi:sec-independent protein translocase protein TatB